MKATLPDGTLFEGTAEEFKIIHDPTIKTIGHKVAQAANGAGTWNDKKARHFWDSLDVRHGGGKQKKLLQLLIGSGGRTTEEELQKHLSIKGQKLAGVLANLSRNARRETKDEHVKVVKRVYDDKGGRVYFIPDDILHFLKQF
jgi:hypothetical protein